MSIDDDIAALPLVDHHVHGASVGELGRAAFEELITESDRPIPGGTTQFDSQIGFAIRRHCAPVLGLPAYAEPDAYLARRRELGAEEVNRRLLTAAGIDRYLVETGYRGAEITTPARMTELTGRPAHEVVRLEQVAEQVAAEGVAAAEFPDRFAAALHERARGAVGLKSIVAYRYGLHFDPAPPSHAEVVAAASGWLRAGGTRVADPVLLRHLIWTGVGCGLPMQFHVGYGDPDLDLHVCDPLRMTAFLRRVEPHGVPIMLLHTYPFHRNAAYLAQVFPHVYFDVGLAVNYTGARAPAVVAESLELAPFAKILFSSDAWGPAELHHLGALLWRRATARALRGFVTEEEWPESEAVRVAMMIGAGNARRVYGLEA